MLLLNLLLACAEPEPCAPRPAVVTDIDETLTLSDQEWLSQMVDPTHDPALRPDAAALLTGYAQLGYAVFYVTARGTQITLGDGRPAQQATQDWLVAHGFPDPDRLYLAPDVVAVAGDDAVAFKSAVLAQLQADGWRFDHAYGNADSDIEAFHQAGLPRDTMYVVGELAGQVDAVGIPDDQAFTAHLGVLDAVPEATCP